MFGVCWLQGDVVSLVRCVDTNWYEGELGGRRGLFPVSYVEQLVDGGLSPATSPLPISMDIAKIRVFDLILTTQLVM